MLNQFGANVVNGTLVPDSNAIRELVNTLRSDIEANPQLADNFNQDPRGVLGDRGLSRDLQVEILRENGLDVVEADCSGTCVSTGSCCCETL